MPLTVTPVKVVFLPPKETSKFLNGLCAPISGTRNPKFLALTNIQTQDGPAPIQAEIEANHLEEAVNKFQEKLDQVVGSLIEETQKQEEEK